jgi:hypothetical protein
VADDAGRVEVRDLAVGDAHRVLQVVRDRAQPGAEDDDDLRHQAAARAHKVSAVRDLLERVAGQPDERRVLVVRAARRVVGRRAVRGRVVGDAVGGAREDSGRRRAGAARRARRTRGLRGGERRRAGRGGGPAARVRKAVGASRRPRAARGAAPGRGGRAAEADKSHVARCGRRTAPRPALWCRRASRGVETRWQAPVGAALTAMRATGRAVGAPRAPRGPLRRSICEDMAPGGSRCE